MCCSKLGGGSGPLSGSVEGSVGWTVGRVTGESSCHDGQFSVSRRPMMLRGWKARETWDFLSWSAYALLVGGLPRF